MVIESIINRERVKGGSGRMADGCDRRTDSTRFYGPNSASDNDGPVHDHAR